MKKHSILRLLTMVTLFVSAILFFSSCQQDDAIGAQELPITTRSTPPDVPSTLVVGEGFEVSCHVYADGYQVYVCTETAPGVYAWVFKEPIATLYANAGFNGVVGTHYVGPTWESNSGSKVGGVRIDGATVDPNAIPWLLLGGVNPQGPGIFEGTTHIQRVNTVGGKAPAASTANASTVGDEAYIPYTAEYYFYTPE